MDKAVDYFLLPQFRLECTKHAVPNDQNTSWRMRGITSSSAVPEGETVTIVAVNAVRIAAVVDPMVGGSVEDPL